MTNIDQFESVFKAADKPVFAPEKISIGSALLVVDIDRPSAEPLLQSAHNLLRGFHPECLWVRFPAFVNFLISHGDLLQNSLEDVLCGQRSPHKRPE